MRPAHDQLGGPYNPHMGDMCTFVSIWVTEQIRIHSLQLTQLLMTTSL